MKGKAVMYYKKTTPGTVVFEVKGDNAREAPIRTVYVKRDLVEEPYESKALTIEYSIQGDDDS